MNQFEKDIESTFESYAERGVATLMMLPVEKKVVYPGGKPTIIYAKKSPFDVIGYRVRDAVIIGAELKESQWKTSVPIVGPGAKGDGLAYHQLEALAELAHCGGIARLLWCNDGHVGVIKDKELVEIFTNYKQAWNSKKAGRRPKPGALSIKWEYFAPIVPGEGGLLVDWLA